MDRALEKKNWPPRRMAIYAGTAVTILTLVSLVIANSGTTRNTSGGELLSSDHVKKSGFQY
jgi:hypothetical protein